MAPRNTQTDSLRLNTSMYVRRDYHAALEELGKREAAKRHVERVGLGQLVEEALEPYFRAKGVNVEEFARKEGA
jgi:hypothetical protein